MTVVPDRFQTYSILTAIQENSYIAHMKTTIDLPDELYRQVKAKSALQGKRIRDLTIELYRQWLASTEAQSAAPTPEAWLEEWVRLGAESMRSAPPGPTATEILEAGRRRLEPHRPC